MYVVTCNDDVSINQQCGVRGCVSVPGTVYRVMHIAVLCLLWAVGIMHARMHRKSLARVPPRHHYRKQKNKYFIAYSYS